jgi:hypothetical protein
MKIGKNLMGNREKSSQVEGFSEIGGGLEIVLLWRINFYPKNQ